MERFALNGKRALVTGSTQGIGLAIARGLAESGASVILNGRSSEKLSAAHRELSAEGHTVESLAFDVTNPNSIKAALASLTESGKHIDILINNAGIQRRAPLLEMTLADWQAVIDTNLTSAFLVSQAVAPSMIERKSGKIVNVCSLMSELARPTIANYSAAKGGLKMLTRSMCAEWAKNNIQINGLAPGYIETEMTKSLVQDEKFDSWIRGRTPSGRWGCVEDLVGATIFLSSPASNYVNGHLLVVDGGLSAVV
ncbi:MAG: SDR family oxidoreductase [Verrucomicrobia bacterium]|nr:MAG: SDR family oxidoreductase [Verrucomicrobiota bacterium]